MNNHSEKANIIFFSVLIFVITIFACVFNARPAPVVNSFDTPFVVQKIGITLNNPGMVKYFGNVSAGNTQKPYRPCIVAPQGMYNIGDTIVVTTMTELRK